MKIKKERKVLEHLRSIKKGHLFFEVNVSKKRDYKKTKIPIYHECDPLSIQL